MKKADICGAVIGLLFAHVEKFLQQTWWKDWVQPLLLSFSGAIIGVIVFHYGPGLLRKFDNWRTIRKLKKYKDNWNK